MSDVELLTHVKALARDERVATVQLIASLAELDAHAGAQFDRRCVEALRTALGRNLSKTPQVEAA